ncbi:MAG: hypothetical protein K940chlam1_00979 [Candidatus Anoxychlamydiales bacterium]|nr:hypothetical protein [Candidatus Anoxychlamydiales bacterium]NGX36123.1 hypothetical protein [Candidatus Anoxychlamydiales bacterium]
MADGAGKLSWKCTLSFSTLICRYKHIQSAVVKQVQNLASSLCKATPGKFLLVQFAMSQVTQIGESISNLINQVNVMVNMAVRNQKGQ